MPYGPHGSANNTPFLKIFSICRPPQLKEQAADSISVLEGALRLKKDFYIHTLRTLDLLAAEASTTNGETESSTAGLRISAEELHCQVSVSQPF